VAGAAAAGEVEAQVDVELFEQRQGDGRAAGGGAHVGQQAGEGGLVGAAGDEPQVVAVLAPVVVIDAGEGVDDGDDAGQVAHRHGHRGEGAGADPVGGEDRADAADLAAVTQPLEPGEHVACAAAEACRDGRPRLGDQRETALEVVEQREVEGVGVGRSGTCLRAGRQRAESRAWCRYSSSEADALPAGGEEDARGASAGARCGWRRWWC
jgi:hypothetical protein